MKNVLRGLNTLRNDPNRVIIFVVSIGISFIFRLKRGLIVGKKLKLVGVPLIDIRNGANIILGDGVTLNSRNKGYHLNMHSSVKLFADKKGAEIRIGAGSRINGACIHACEQIILGERCLVAANTQIIDSNGHDACWNDISLRGTTEGNASRIIIEDDVWIGANAIVLPGVRIGKGAIIGAGSVVNCDIPAMSIATGNPAIVVRRYEG